MCSILNSDNLIQLMIIVCFIILVGVIFSGVFKFIFRFLLNGAIGYFIFTLMNTAGFSIGGNIVTVVLSGFLGIPGIFAIIAVNAII